MIGDVFSPSNSPSKVRRQHILPSTYALSTRAGMECVAHVVQAFTSLDPSPSTYIWEDEVGDVSHVSQGEGGEQGDF